jgi:hypothetical protein
MSDEKPTVEELEHVIFHGKMMAVERKISDDKYADKKEFGLVQKIVFAMIAFILFAFLSGLTALVVIKP